MSRLISTIFIFALISYTMIISYNFISNTSKNFTNECNAIKFYIENSDLNKAEKKLSKFIKSFKKDQTKLLFITDHDVVEELEIKLKKTLSYIQERDKVMAISELTETINIMSVLYGAQKPTIENIL